MAEGTEAVSMATRQKARIKDSAQVQNTGFFDGVVKRGQRSKFILDPPFLNVRKRADAKIRSFLRATSIAPESALPRQVLRCVGRELGVRKPDKKRIDINRVARMPCSAQVSAVVPVPQNGSSTRSRESSEPTSCSTNAGNRQDVRPQPVVTPQRPIRP